MQPYFPISNCQSEKFRKSGILLMLRLGKCLNKLSNDQYCLLGEEENKKQEPILREIREMTDNIVLFFETDKHGQLSPLKHFLKNNNAKTTICIPKLLIVSLLAYRLVHQGEVCMSISAVAAICSSADPDFEPILEFRRKIAVMVIERTLEVLDGRASHQMVPYVGLGSSCAETILGGKHCIASIDEATISALRAENGKKVSIHGKYQCNDTIPRLSAKTIFQRFQNFVIGNEHILKSLSVRLSLHLQKGKMILNGENVTAPNEVLLMIGSPSSGKSYIASCIPKVLNAEPKNKVGYYSASAVDFTECGYIGLDVAEQIPKGLISSAGNATLARAGVAFIDEIDKRCFKNSASSSTDISAGMQFGLLRLVEGSEQILNEKKFTRFDPITFNSYGVCFLLGGAFEGLDELIKQRLKKSGGMGFGEKINEKESIQLLTDALVDYGISRQLLSRCNSILRLQDPTINELLRILDFDKGILASYNQILSPLNISLSNDAKQVIAEYALETQTFARGMKRVVSQLIECVVFEGREGNIEIQGEDVKTILDVNEDEPATTLRNIEPMENTVVHSIYA